MRFSDGLPTKLRYAVPPKPKPPLPPPVHTAQEVTPPKSKSTFPRFFKSSKSRSPVAQTKLDELGRERKLSKDVDPLLSSPQIKERNLSLPSDDLMNRVCLPSSPQSNMSLSLSPASDQGSPVSAKFKKSPRKTSSDILNFHSLKYSKGKSIIIDGMKSLKITKKDKSKLKESNDNATNLVNNDHFSKSLKNLNFSADFKEDDDALYKIPNSIPIAADVQNHNILSSMATLPSTNRLTAQQHRMDNGNDELKLFTESDKCINNAIECDNLDKDNSIEEIYFVEAPTKAIPIASVSVNYIQFKQIPYFPAANFTDDHSDPTSSNVINNNSTVMPSTSPSRAERILSVDSTFSNEFDLLLQNKANGNSANFNSPNYYIPPTSIHLDVVLGTGEFGSVYKGHIGCETQNGESKEIPVAIKTLLNEQCNENRIEFLREASVMIKLSHHCIVKMIGISKVNFKFIQMFNNEKSFHQLPFLSHVSSFFSEKKIDNFNRDHH